MKANLYNIGTAFALTLGVAINFSHTEKANAQELKASDSLMRQSGIPCWNSARFWPTFRYLHCPTCSMKNGKPTGSAETCGAGNDDDAAVYR